MILGGLVPRPVALAAQLFTFATLDIKAAAANPRGIARDVDCADVLTKTPPPSS
jgi:hypothetical protein